MFKIKLYISYWLIMLSYYPYRDVFAYELSILREAFKVISHPKRYDSATVTANYVTFVTINSALHELVEQYKREQIKHH